MSILDRVVIAAPCSMSWENMEGDERVRYCQGCSKNVYNISDMSKTEAEQFLQDNGTNECIRLFRRQDGTLITDNCPVGLRHLRNKCQAAMRTIAAAAASLITFIPGANAQTTQDKFLTGKPASGKIQSTQKPAPANGGLTFRVPAERDINESLGGDSIPIAPIAPGGKKTIVIGADECSSSKHTTPPMPAPKNGDMSSFNLYNSAKKSEAEGKLMVAHVQYINAIEAARKQKNSDPKMMSYMLQDLNKLRSKMGMPQLKSEAEIDKVKILY